MKVVDVAPSVMPNLPCDFFQRCGCDEEQPPKTAERKNSLKEVLDLLKINMPNLGFGLKMVSTI